MFMQFLGPGDDLARAVPGEFDPVLVAISVYAAVMASYAAITLADRMRETRPGALRALWLAAGAIAMGGGVWTMHFIGMLAFRLPIAMRYDVPATLVSMVPAIFAAGVTLYVITVPRASTRRIAVGGVFMGAGVGLMHYTGMAAMRFAGDMRYDPWLVLLSILVANGLAILSLHVRFALPATRVGALIHDWGRILSAAIMGVAIAGMHYTAMAAVYFFPRAGGDMAAGSGDWVVSPGTLGTEIGVTAGVIIGLLIVALHESEMRQRRLAERQIRHAHEELEARVAERTRDLAAINELSNVLQSSVTVDDACDAVRAFAGRFLPGTHGVVYVSRGDERYLERVKFWGQPISDDAVLARAECWALRRGAIHAVGDTTSGLVCPHVRTGETAAYVCAPLIAQGDNVGLLYLEHARQPAAAETPPLVRLVSEQLSLALANIRLRESLFSQSTRDALTGLFNRRYLMDTLSREFARAARHASPLAMVLLDADHFKRINDGYGHDAGDMVLREIAASLQANVRASDVAARYGGEEFAIVLIDATRAQAAAVAEKIRTAVQALELGHEERRLDRATLSAGVAVFPDDASSPEDLIRVADRRLYRAKALGRNRVVAESAEDEGG